MRTFTVTALVIIIVELAALVDGISRHLTLLNNIDGNLAWMNRHLVDIKERRQ